VNDTLRRPGVARTALATTLALLLGAAVLAVGRAEAGGHKTFTVDLDPSSIVADTPTWVTFTITNTAANPITMQAVNITIPDGVTVTGESEVIELRDLGLTAGSTTTHTYEVTAACAEEPYVWLVDARQANNFNSDDNVFDLEGDHPTLDVPCVTEPTSPPDDNGNGNGTPFTPPGGWDQTTSCRGGGNQPCELEHESDTTGVTLKTGGNATLFLSLRDADDIEMACGDGFASESDAVFFDVRGHQLDKTITVTIKNAEGDVDDYEVCYGGDAPFLQKDDLPAVFDGQFFWVGIIGACPEGSSPPFLGGTIGKPSPCVMSKDVVGDDVVIVIWAPPGDPLIKIG
jgi:hypothetical protein